jgi:tripeptide aminopeptidase
MKIPCKFLAIVLFLAHPASAQSPDIVIDRVLGNSRFKAAVEFLANDHDRITNETIQITEIEAPPFKEKKRAEAYLQMLKQHGLSNVEMDTEGNVMGLRKGTAGGSIIAIASHLDTVFPEGTDVKVKRQSNRLLAPGIGDNSRSLAVLLGLIRAMDAARIQTRNDILFIGNVGEEGPGDLRGMKYLFQKGPYKDRIKMFISMDGAGNGSQITNGALGSKRYRVTFKGPGGHSYDSFGLVNPAYALAKAMDKLSKIQVPSNPKTTFNVGLIGGGTSVNSIPFESWMEVDIRSESSLELAKTAETFIGLMHEAVAEENKVRHTLPTGKIDLEMKIIGDRPSGTTSVGSTIVQTASAAIRAFGLQPLYLVGSTDSNIPISMKIPAITIDSGGEGGRGHALDEWINIQNESSLRGINIALALLLALAEMQ